MKQILIFLGILFLTVPTTIQAQDTGWQITVFDFAGSRVVVLTEDGISQEFPVPKFAEFDTAYAPVLSPDGKLLAFVGQNNNEDGQPEAVHVYIADLENGTCCQQMPDPLEEGADIVYLGPFSPDSTQIAATVSRIYTQTESLTFPIAVVAFDVRAGEVAAVLPDNSMMDGSVAIFGAWDKNGLQIAPGCLACEGPSDATFQYWDVETGEISEPETYVNFAQDVLPATGEAVAAIEEKDFPVIQDDALISPGTIVAYYADRTEATSIIYRAEELIGRAAWVLNGDAILITLVNADFSSSTQAVLLYRDGRQQILDLPVDGFVLSGTQDGWLLFEPDKKQVFHYQVGESGEVSSRLIADFDSYLRVLQSPVLLPSHEGFSAVQ